MYLMFDNYLHVHLHLVLDILLHLVETLLKHLQYKVVLTVTADLLRNKTQDYVIKGHQAKMQIITHKGYLRH